MSWNIRALVVAAIAAFILIAPPGLRWSADVTAAGVAAVAPAQEQVESPVREQAAEPAAESQAADNPEIQAPINYTGTTVKVKRARTETTAVNIGFPGLWRTLTNATLVHVIPAFTSDLFNVSLSAECTKFGGGQARIRVLDNGVAMQPYDGFRIFCSSGLPATYTATWSRRPPTSAVNVAHTLTVQFMNSAGSVTIDDWNFELVVYN